MQVTKKTVAEWEQGRQLPSPERVVQLARMAPPGRLRGWFLRHALERIGVETPLVQETLFPGPSARRGQRPLPAAELRIVTPAEWRDRLQALEEFSHYVPIPILKDEAAAGSPREISEADIDAYAVIHVSWCPNPAHFTCVRIRGDSMVPVLRDGALVAIDHTQRDPVKLNQKMVAARVEEGVTIKWLERHSETELRLVPENKDHPTRVLPRTRRNPLIGLVAWWWHRQR